MSEVEQRDYRPAANWERLRLRAALLARLREFFSARGFLEVETPLLSADIVVDRHLEPLAVSLPEQSALSPAMPPQLWLQTSPEAAMKRLMAAGAEAIYQITRSFRGGEQGRLHNLEFTIVEWYRRGDGLAAGMTLLDELCQHLLQAKPARRTTYGDAFLARLAIDPHRAAIRDIRAAAAREQLSVPPDFDHADRDSWLQLLLACCIEPHLGRDRPELLYGYPASQAALARLDADDPQLAERFELYVDGIELANGFHELTDPAVLRQREAKENAARVADGKPSLPGAKRLLQAMEAGLPDCCGCALGFDRVVMLAAGAESIDQVIAFPVERA